MRTCSNRPHQGVSEVVPKARTEASGPAAPAAAGGRVMHGAQPMRVAA